MENVEKRERNREETIKKRFKSFLFKMTGRAKQREQNSTVHNTTVQFSTVLYCIVQYSTIQYSTVQYRIVQYSTVQYSRAEQRDDNVFQRRYLAYSTLNDDFRTVIARK